MNNITSTSLSPLETLEIMLCEEEISHAKLQDTHAKTLRDFESFRKKHELETESLRASFLSEISSLSAEISSLSAENSALSAEISSLSAENSALSAENTRLSADNLHLNSELYRVLNSKIWRFSCFVKRFFRFSVRSTNNTCDETANTADSFVQEFFPPEPQQTASVTPCEVPCENQQSSNTSQSAPVECTDENNLEHTVILKNQVINALDPLRETELKSTPHIAIQAHVYYTEMIEQICSLLSNIPFAYDLYVTTTEKHRATYLRHYLEKNCTAKNFQVLMVENRGRDVYPFIAQMKPVIHKYDYFCHIHTKKTLYQTFGVDWKEYLFTNLLGTPEQIHNIICTFESNPQIGMIFPDNPDFLKEFINWGDDKAFAEVLMERMNFPTTLPDDIIFAAGNMFWARVAAVKSVFDIDFTAKDFPDEAGQCDGTIMHAIERIWVPVSNQNGYVHHLIASIY